MECVTLHSAIKYGQHKEEGLAFLDLASGRRRT